MGIAKSCVVYGAGGHGKVVADAVIASGGRVLGFLDDQVPEGTVVLGSPDCQLRVLGTSAWLDNRALGSIVIGLGIGSNDVRKNLSEALTARGFTLATVVHPTAAVSPFAVLGLGTVVMAHAVINPAARTGLGVIVNTGAILEHDCIVGDFAHVSPNASLAGAARLGTLSHVGTGAVLLPGIEVGVRSIVGAGAVVIRNIGDDQLVMGVPAKSRVQGPS